MDNYCLHARDMHVPASPRSLYANRALIAFIFQDLYWPIAKDTNNVPSLDNELPAMRVATGSFSIVDSEMQQRGPEDEEAMVEAGHGRWKRAPQQIGEMLAA